VIRVGISALTLVPGAVGGSETAYTSLLREYHKYPEIVPRVFLPKIAPDAAEHHAHSVIRSYSASTSTPGRLYAMGSSLALGGRIRREMRLDDLDVLHFPFSTMIPRVTSVPTVTSILDLQHEYLPEFFSKPELAYRKLIYGRSARASDLVIAISEHAKMTLVERLGIPQERVRVIHLGVDLEKFAPSSEPRTGFLFYPANRWPHKNHERLFEAFSILRQEHPDLRLVLTGVGHDAFPLPDGVQNLGRVSEEQLVRLYQTAAVLVYPSLFEGFGIPLVEAMATRCPIAAADSSSIPEVAGGAAELFNPRSSFSIAAGIERALKNADRLANAGAERVKQFTWERSAAAHVGVYRELAQR
jgi:glycosyltransferase involved in cell wall biosynthesis